MGNLKKWGYLLVLLFIVSSCNFEDIQFKGAENFKLKEIKGKNISLSFDAILENPNKYTIKVKPSSFDLHINGNQVGIVHLDEMVKIIKRSDGKIAVPVTAELANGALPRLIAAALKSSASVRVVGTVKGGIGILTKKKKIDETRDIPLNSLDFGLPF